MSVRGKNSTRALVERTKFSVLYQNGCIAETTHGHLLIFPSRKVAEAVAREIGGKVGQVKIESAENRGRKTDPKVLAAWREWEFARKKPSYRKLTEEYYGPFEKTRKGRCALTKKTASLARLIRGLRKKADRERRTFCKPSEG